MKGGEYCANCGIAPTEHKDAEDEELQKKLWEVTEEQVRIVEVEGALPR